MEKTYIVTCCNDTSKDESFATYEEAKAYVAEKVAQIKAEYSESQYEIEIDEEVTKFCHKIVVATYERFICVARYFRIHQELPIQ